MTDPIPLADAVKEYQARQARAAAEQPTQLFEGKTLVERLRARWGTGDDPSRRLALYRRLQRLLERYPKEVGTIISECSELASDTTIRKPGNYFAAAITRRLREAGIVESGC